MDRKHPDAELIRRLGGPTAVAERLGYDPKAGGWQRVNNWRARGIPEVIRLRRPDVFGAVGESLRPDVYRTPKGGRNG